MSTPAVHAISLLQFVPYLAARDIDVLEFFRRHGLSPNIFQRHNDWIPREFCLDLTNALARETGNPFAGAFLGGQVPVLEFGELGRQLATTETVQTCLATAIRNLGLVHRGSRITSSLERDRLTLRFSLDGDLAQDPQQFILATLAVLRNIALLSDEPGMVTVRLLFPYDLRCSVLEECLGGNLEFGCDHYEVEIRSELLDKPLNTHNERGSPDHALNITISAAMLISGRLPSRPVGIDNIAAELGLTRRTLQRRLAACGVQFCDLIDITRRDIAIKRVVEGCGSLKELSLDLGYSDQAHFTRTFRRWTGTAPSHFPQSDGKTGLP